MKGIPKYREIFLLIGTYIFSVPGLKIEIPQNLDLVFVAMLFMDIGYHFRNSIDENSKKIEKIGLVAFFIWVIFNMGKKYLHRFSSAFIYSARNYCSYLWKFMHHSIKPVV